MVIDQGSLEIKQRSVLNKGKNTKILHLNPNKTKDCAYMNFSDKLLVLQDMSNLEKLVKISFVNLPGSPTPPVVVGDHGFIIP